MRAHNYLATKYLQAGRAPAAIDELRRALQIAPEDAEAHSNLGSALSAQGQVIEASAHLGPSSTASWMPRSRICAR